MDHFVIRRACTRDAAAINAIYNHYVVNSTATFDTEPQTLAEREAWLVERDQTHPAFVVTMDGDVIAWGALTPFGTRPAWSPTVEVAVYVAAGHTGAGIGPLLLEHLIEAARAAGHHVVVSRIVADNEASLKITRAAGFELVGTMREVGWKFDRWLDVVIMQRILDEEGEEGHVGMTGDDTGER